jgi:DNA-binding beta-propeller fold protein YncE
MISIQRPAKHACLLATAIILMSASPLTAQAGSKGALFYLDLSGQVMRSNVDGSDAKPIVQGMSGTGPDGIAVDAAAGHVYWSNMGKVSENDGSIMRADLDGKNVVTIVAAGGTFTPKQIKLDPQHKKIYWSDREGMRVMRANYDGSNIETLIVTGQGDAERKDQSRWCVGIAIDVAGGKVYWTQKGSDNANQGTIKRANLEPPAGADPARRQDIEVLFASLPEPIDLELDLKTRQIYWTDRGDNTVSRAPMDIKKSAGFDPAKRKDREILVTGMHEAIGIALDERNKRLYYTSLRGEVGTAKFNGKDAKMLKTDHGRLTGIAFVEVKDPK